MARKKTTLTKKQVLEMYLDDFGARLPSDKVAARMQWLDFTDYLYKNSRITMRAWDYWTVPKEVMKNCK